MSEWQSDSIGKLATALALAKPEFKAIVKDTENPAYARGGKAMKYADLSTIIEATEEALAKHGLSLIQSPDVNVADHSMTLIGMLVHSSGEWMRFVTTLPAVQRDRFDAQSCGSAITYARRYQYKSIIGAAEEDDDANAASGIGSRDAAKAVGDKKVAEFEAKKTNGSGIPRAVIPKDGAETEALLKASIAQNEEKKAKLNLPPIPDPEPPKPRSTATGGDVDDVVGVIESIQDKKTKEKRDYKVVTIRTLFNEILELSAFDNFKLSDGTLFQYLAEGAVNMEATFTYVSKPAKTGDKVYHNIINVSRIGNHRWDDGFGVLEQAAR